jgi:hypothetical protein
MAEFADTIVVGDIVYRDIKKALKTVKIKVLYIPIFSTIFEVHYWETI